MHIGNFIINVPPLEQFLPKFDLIKRIHVKQDYPVVETLKHSIAYEKDRVMSKEDMENLSDYLLRTYVPQIHELYPLMMPGHQYERDTQKIVGDVPNISNVGMNYQLLRYDYLQEFINEIYTLDDEVTKPLIAFIGYLLYERIHPHHDGNGRIGRCIFIEHLFDYEYFPLSISLLYCKTIDDLHIKILRKFSFPQVLHLPKSRDNNQQLFHL